MFSAVPPAISSLQFGFVFNGTVSSIFSIEGKWEGGQEKGGKEEGGKEGSLIQCVYCEM